MSSSLPRSLDRIAFETEAEEYLRSLPLEHFMESTLQSHQRKITVESLDLVSARRADVQVFSELLVQYRLRFKKEIRKVVPDNMVVIHPEPIRAKGSYDLPFQPVGPFWVMEYISRSNKRKDYEDSFQKYERELKVPYYLMFYPDEQELTLYHRGRTRYVSVKPDSNGRLALPELELYLALHEGWVRFWYQGQLLPLPADLQSDLDAARRQLADASRRLEDASRQLADASQEALVQRQRAETAEQEIERLRQELERLRGA